MALPRALFSAAVALRYSAEIHGRLRNALRAAARHYARKCRGPASGHARNSLSRPRLTRGGQEMQDQRIKFGWSAAALAALMMIAGLPSANAQNRWPEKPAADWYAKQPWLVGSNYIPATAINELEMWQADTFDPHRIDLELGWAESIGMNTMRVVLLAILWQPGATGMLIPYD